MQKMQDQPYLFQNIFFDLGASLHEGQPSVVNQRMVPLQIPKINTLIYKTDQNIPNISRIQVTTSGIPSSSRPTEASGIVLNLSLAGMTPQMDTQISSYEIPSQTLGRTPPSNPRETLDMLHLVTGQKAGKRNATYTISELKQIAKNLQLNAQGSKEMLANRIRNHIIEYYNLPPQ